MENITSIQIHQNIKRELDRIKTEKESYEEAIMKLIEKVENQKTVQKKLLIEGYKEMAEESLKITKEFEVADKEVEEKYGN